MKKFLLGIISISVMNGIYIERLKADLDSQFEQESKIYCDATNAKFVSVYKSGQINGFACNFNGVVYNNNVKYSNGKFNGYYGLNKAYTLDKQTSKFTSSGNIELKLYKEKPEGIVSYTCITNEIGGKCTTNVKKYVHYQRIDQIKN